MSLNLELDLLAVRDLVSRALKEDIGTGDLTGESVVVPDRAASMRVTAGAPGVIAGLALAALVLRELDPQMTFTPTGEDGARVSQGETVFEVHGSARALLAGERTALNFLGHLSGIATLTRRYVDAVAESRAAIVDTRKTTPAFRVLEKYATRVGGARNHRLGLYHFVLIKENHLAAAGCDLGEAIARARAAAPASGVELHAEAESLAEVEAALAAGADCVLCDEFSLETLRRAVALRGRLRPDARLEASGGVTLETVAAIAATGVDRISVGALTHSAPSLDLSARLS